MMKIKGLILTAAIVGASALMVSCGGHKASSPEADMQRSELYEAMKAGDIARVEVVADSLSLMTDDLTTDETVAVLLAFLQVHNDAAARNDSKKDLVTIRKFVDVYDIALARDGKALEKAFNSARSLNGNVDLPEIARQFRERLADYDEASGDESPVTEPAPEKTEEPAAEAAKAEEPKTEEPKAAEPAPETTPID